MSNREKTVLRTIRIPYEIDQLLQKDAKTKRVSVNSLIYNLLLKYVEWDRYSERFGRVLLRPQTLKLVIDLLDDSEIEKIGKDVGKKIPKEFLLFWFKEINLQSFLEYISLLCRYGGFAHHEIESNEGSFMITLVHDLGDRWSLFLKNIIEEGMITTLAIRPRISVSEMSVVVNFRA